MQALINLRFMTLQIFIFKPSIYYLGKPQKTHLKGFSKKGGSIFRKHGSISLKLPPLLVIAPL